MSILLNIDTAVQASSICLSQNDQALGVKVNPSQKDSAAWLHIAIKELLEEKKLSPHQLDAITVSAGPGSYTGLRVGMATAKGLCYALQKPLITISTLEMMAMAAINEPTDLICPMIDARRMEVFTAVFDKKLNPVFPTTNLVLDQTSFEEFLQKLTISFFGNGSVKFQSLINNRNAFFKTINITAEFMIPLTMKKLELRDFADLAYSEPLYGKEFHSPVK